MVQKFSPGKHSKMHPYTTYREEGNRSGKGHVTRMQKWPLAPDETGESQKGVMALSDINHVMWVPRINHLPEEY